MERSGEAFRNILVDYPLRNLAITHEINFNISFEGKWGGNLARDELSAKKRCIQMRPWRRFVANKFSWHFAAQQESEQQLIVWLEHDIDAWLSISNHKVPDCCTVLESDFNSVEVARQLTTASQSLAKRHPRLWQELMHMCTAPATMCVLSLVSCFVPRSFTLILWFYDDLRSLIRQIEAGEMIYHRHWQPSFDICAANINTLVLQGDQVT